MEIVKMGHKNGSFEISVDNHLKKIKLISEDAYDVLKSCNNYIELHMRHSSGEEFVFTMQKKKGPTPSEYRTLLEREVLKLQKEIKGLKNTKR